MTPVEVVFRNVRKSDVAEVRIRKNAEDLGVIYPRLQTCRVVVDLPHRHRGEGNRFRVRIQLAVRGAPDIIIVDHRAPGVHLLDDERLAQRKHDEPGSPHPELSLAIHDAFEAARRRLHDFAERRRSAARSRASGKRAVSESTPS